MPNGRRRRFSVKQNVATTNNIVRSESQSRTSSKTEHKPEKSLQSNKQKQIKSNTLTPGSTKSSKLDVVIECEKSPAAADKNVMASSSNIDFYNKLNINNLNQVETLEPRRVANPITVVDKKDTKSAPRRDKPRQHRMKVRSPKRKPDTSEESKMENDNKLTKNLDNGNWDLEHEEKEVENSNEEHQLAVLGSIKKHVNDTHHSNPVNANNLLNLTILANPTNQINPFNQPNPTVQDNAITDSSSYSQSNPTSQINQCDITKQNNAVVDGNIVNAINSINQCCSIAQNHLTSQNNPTNQNDLTYQNIFLVESNINNAISPVNQCNSLNQNNQNHPSNNSFDVMCRICHGGDSASPELGQMISACGCRGTVGRVHVKCLERWLTESGKSRCELCGTRYSTRRVHKYGFPKALAIWVLSQNAKQLMVDSLGIMLMSPLAVVAAWLSGRTLAGLMTPESQQTPWPLASTFVLACMTLVCYYCWIVSAVTRHALGWWIWYRSQYEVRLQLQDEQD